MGDPTVIPTLRATILGHPFEEGVQDVGDGLVLEANDGNLLLIVTNDSGNAQDITIRPQAEMPGGLTLSDTVVVIPANAVVPVGPFPPVLYNDAQQRVTVSAVGTGLLFSATGV